MTSSAPSSAVMTTKKAIPIVCPGHTRPLAELQFCTGPEEDGSPLYLSSACHDRLPMVRNGETGDWIGTLQGHKGAVWSCRMSRGACLIATASGDFSVRVWDAVTGAPLWQWSHQHILKTCDFSPATARYLASGGQEGILRIYDLVQQEAAQQQKPPNHVAPLEIRPVPLVAGGGGDGKIAIGKLNWYDEATVLIGCSDGTIRFYSMVTPDAPLHVLTTQEGAEIRDMELTTLPDQRRILSVATGQTVYFYDCTTLTTPPQLLQSHRLAKIHFRNEGGISLHPVSGDRFLVGGSDLYIYVHDFTTGAELDCYKGHHGPIRCLRYAPDGTRFASGSEDGTIRLWQ